jgi:hypothetical protein
MEEIDVIRGRTVGEIPPYDGDVAAEGGGGDLGAGDRQRRVRLPGSTAERENGGR